MKKKNLFALLAGKKSYIACTAAAIGLGTALSGAPMTVNAEEVVQVEASAADNENTTVEEGPTVEADNTTAEEAPTVEADNTTAEEVPVVETENTTAEETPPVEGESVPAVENVETTPDIEETESTSADEEADATAEEIITVYEESGEADDEALATSEMDHADSEIADEDEPLATTVETKEATEETTATTEDAIVIETDEEATEDSEDTLNPAEEREADALETVDFLIDAADVLSPVSLLEMKVPEPGDLDLEAQLADLEPETGEGAPISPVDKEYNVGDKYDFNADDFEENYRYGYYDKAIGYSADGRAFVKDLSWRKGGYYISNPDGTVYHLSEQFEIIAIEKNAFKESGVAIKPGDTINVNYFDVQNMEWENTYTHGETYSYRYFKPDYDYYIGDDYELSNDVVASDGGYWFTVFSKKDADYHYVRTTKDGLVIYVGRYDDYIQPILPKPLYEESNALTVVEEKPKYFRGESFDSEFKRVNEYDMNDLQIDAEMPNVVVGQFVDGTTYRKMVVEYINADSVPNPEPQGTYEIFAFADGSELGVYNGIVQYYTKDAWTYENEFTAEDTIENLDKSVYTNEFYPFILGGEIGRHGVERLQLHLMSYSDEDKAATINGEKVWAIQVNEDPEAPYMAWMDSVGNTLVFLSGDGKVLGSSYVLGKDIYRAYYPTNKPRVPKEPEEETPEETPEEPQEETPEETPEEPQEETPEEPEEETPEEPKEETPEEPEEETPEKPEEETPEEPEEETPEEPQEETPEEPQEETPEEPEEETPEEPQEETPEEPKEKTPEEPKSETPGEPEEETPEQPKDETPDVPQKEDGQVLGETREPAQETVITVAKPASQEDTLTVLGANRNAKTGDTADEIIYVGIGAMGMIALGMWFVEEKRRKRH